MSDFISRGDVPRARRGGRACGDLRRGFRFDV
jgi:hypothetical protein